MRVALSGWMLWFDVAYRLAVVAFPVAVAVALLWLRANFVIIKEFRDVEQKVSTIMLKLELIDVRIEHLGDEDKEPPTRSELREQLGDLSDRMSRIEAHAEADRRQSAQQYHALDGQLKTFNQYLHTLVERSMGVGQ